MPPRKPSSASEGVSTRHRTRSATVDIQPPESPSRLSRQAAPSTDDSDSDIEVDIGEEESQVNRKLTCWGHCKLAFSQA